MVSVALEYRDLEMSGASEEGEKARQMKPTLELQIALHCDKVLKRSTIQEDLTKSNPNQSLSARPLKNGGMIGFRSRMYKIDF